MFIKVMRADTGLEARVNVLHIVSMEKKFPGQNDGCVLIFTNGTKHDVHNSMDDLNNQLNAIFGN